MIENCPMRHENGNCIPAGGFCTANKNICEALRNAYRMGKAQLSQEGATFDTISRQAAIDAVRASYDEILDFKSTGRTVADSVEDIISELPAAKSEFYWRQFKTRPLTEEEKEMYPNIDRSLDCELPKNGQKILVTVINRECDPVQTDIYYNDSGECHLDSLNDIETEATAWMPLPDPYKGGKNEAD